VDRGSHPDELVKGLRTTSLEVYTYTTWFSRLALSLPKIASIDAHDLGDRVELAESVARIRDDQKDRRHI